MINKTLDSNKQRNLNVLRILNFAIKWSIKRRQNGKIVNSTPLRVLLPLPLGRKVRDSKKTANLFCVFEINYNALSQFKGDKLFILLLLRFSSGFLRLPLVSPGYPWLPPVALLHVLFDWRFLLRVSFLSYVSPVYNGHV